MRKGASVSPTCPRSALAALRDVAVVPGGHTAYEKLQSEYSMGCALAEISGRCCAKCLVLSVPLTPSGQAEVNDMVVSRSFRRPERWMPAKPQFLLSFSAFFSHSYPGLWYVLAPFRNAAIAVELLMPNCWPMEFVELNHTNPSRP
jgi:hypothetical protein